MTRKLILLDLALVALLSYLGWQMHREWVEAHARAQTFLAVKIKKQAAPPLAPLAKVPPLSAVAYAEVAQLNLFSKDRNPQVIIDAPAPVKPKPIPPFPVARGVLLWEGTPATVVLSVRAGGPQKGYRAGERIGDWKIVSVDNQYVVFEWDGQEFKKRIDELMDRTTLVAEAAGPRGGAAPSSAAPAASAPHASQAQSLSDASKSDKWVDVGASDMRGCKPGDDTPVGTVNEGFKKVVTATPFGSACRWEQVK